MKLAVITSNPFYLNNFLKRFETEGNKVKHYAPGQDNDLNVWKLKELCDWADIIWCEFCQNPMALVTNYVSDTPIIARMWRHEIYDTRYLNRVNWENVDLLLVATEPLKEKFLRTRREKISPKTTESFHLPSVDMQKFTYKPRNFATNTKLCIVGDVTPRKRQYEAVQLLLDLPEEVTLSIVGNFVSKEYVTQIQSFIKNNELEKRVSVYGKLNHDILPEFFQDHDIYLSMSVEETAHFAAAEAMSTGCFPILHWWEGIYDVYPSEYVHRKFSSIISSVNQWRLLDLEDKEKAAKAVAEKAQRFSCEEEYSRLIKIVKELAGSDEDSSHVEVLPKDIGIVRDGAGANS